LLIVEKNKINKRMDIIKAETYHDLSNKASILIIDQIKRKNNLLLCTATGNTPIETYNLLSNEYKKKPELFSQLQIIKLDEWGGIPLKHPSSCESYLKKHLLQPLNIPPSRYIGFNSNPISPEDECNTVQQRINEKGPIDLCILGLGMNGHLALNEPNYELNPYCHRAKLSDISLQHSMLSRMGTKPTFGLTLGMANILQSKKIIILISGTQKKDIVKQFLSKKITTFLPASFLWLHNDVICIIEKNAL